MNGSSLARRYADGYLDYAEETIGFEKGLKELIDAKLIFKNHPEILEFLETPAITFEEKASFIKKVFAKGFSDQTRDLLKLLLRKGRICRFVDIAEYARTRYAHGKEVDAVLKVSYPLDTGMLENIKSSLEDKFRVKLHLYMELEPELLGGVRIVIGNMIIDGSVRKRLNDLKQKLIAVKVA